MFLNVFRMAFILWGFFQASSLSASLMLGNQLIAHPSDSKKKIEIIWADSSENTGTFPLLILLHGSSATKGAGGFEVDVFRFWTERGFLTAAISLPGYGYSDGPQDFCGSYTMSALHEVIRFFQKEYEVPAIGVIGFGEGALAAALLTVQRNDTSFAICANGVYDLRRHDIENDPLRAALEKKDYFQWNANELFSRSPQTCAHLIKTPLFLLHRSPHPTVPVEEVLDFAACVNENGGECIVDILPYEGNPRVSHSVLIEEVEDWLFRKY